MLVEPADKRSHPPFFQFLFQIFSEALHRSRSMASTQVILRGRLLLLSVPSALIADPTQEIHDFIFICFITELYRENSEVYRGQPYFSAALL